MPETWFHWPDRPNPAALNMAWDETLMNSGASLDRPLLRFYAWSHPAATFGYFQRFAEIAELTPLRPLIRRPTGGGLVPHDHDFTYSLVLPASNPWHALPARESYRKVHAWVAAALVQLGTDAELSGACPKGPPTACFARAESLDVVHGSQKLAGAAQRRTRAALLIQGSIQPPQGIDRSRLAATLLQVASLQWETDWTPWSPPDLLRTAAESLAASKYDLPSFNQRV